MRIAVLALLVLFGHAFPLLAQEIPKQKMVTFTARVAKVERDDGAAVKGELKGDNVSVKLSAIMFAKPLRIADARTAGKYGNEELDTYIAYKRANMEGTREELAAFWTPDEKNVKYELFGDQDFFDTNRQYHLQNPGLTVIGVVFKEAVSFLLISESKPPGIPAVGVPMVRVDGKLFLTERQNSDPDLAIIIASFK